MVVHDDEKDQVLKNKDEHFQTLFSTSTANGNTQAVTNQVGPVVTSLTRATLPPIIEERIDPSSLRYEETPTASAVEKCAAARRYTFSFPRDPNPPESFAGLPLLQVVIAELWRIKGYYVGVFQKKILVNIIQVGSLYFFEI